MLGRYEIDDRPPDFAVRGEVHRSYGNVDALPNSVNDVHEVYDNACLPCQLQTDILEQYYLLNR